MKTSEPKTRLALALENEAVARAHLAYYQLVAKPEWLNNRLAEISARIDALYAESAKLEQDAKRAPEVIPSLQAALERANQEVYLARVEQLEKARAASMEKKAQASKPTPKKPPAIDEKLVEILLQHTGLSREQAISVLKGKGLA